MGALDIIRGAFRYPATRRLYEADRAAEVWSSAPAASPIHAGAAAGVPVRTPPIDWTRDQPPNAPRRPGFVSGYSDHTYQQFSAPVAFDGFGLDRIRAANTAHRLGTFYESSALMVAVMGFAPVLAALQQAIAPILALPRHVHGGDSELARLVTAEVAEQLVPRGGLLPSPYLPPTLWGTLAIYLRMMGFGALQHIDGDMDPETGIRPRYTRIAEPWAIQRTRSPRKAIFYSTEGPVEICNDGKFTLVEDTNEGYLFDAAILAIGPEAAAGRLTQEARLKWLDFFASPKFALIMAQHVPTGGQAGDAFFAALESMYGPDGRIVLPFGSTVEALSISGEGADQFNSAIVDGIIHIFMVLTGSAGTIGSGGPTGAGPYQAKNGGVWDVKHHLVARPTLAMVRGFNQGHVAPYVAQYPLALAECPVLEVPIPQPDRAERIESTIAREKARGDILEQRRRLGLAEDADQLADALEVPRLVVTAPGKGIITEADMEQKLFAPDELRAQKGYAALPDKMGSVERLAEERAAGGDETGALAKVDAAAAKDDGAPEDVATQEAPADEGGDGPGTLRSGKTPPKNEES